MIGKWCTSTRYSNSKSFWHLLYFDDKKYHRDEIQPSILVKVSHVISPLLSIIINRCVLSGVYPHVETGTCCTNI